MRALHEGSFGIVRKDLNILFSLFVIPPFAWAPGPEGPPVESSLFVREPSVVDLAWEALVLQRCAPPGVDQVQVCDQSPRREDWHSGRRTDGIQRHLRDGRIESEAVVPHH